MEIIELNKFKTEEDINYPFALKYAIDNIVFYIEPNFYSQLCFYKEKNHDDYLKIIDELIKNAMRNKNVIFTGDYENPLIKIDGFIYQEIEDITNPIGIFTNFISSENGYGD